jgi:hypothetical protein
MIILILFQLTVDRYYRLGTREGFLKSLYSRIQLTISKKNLTMIGEVPVERTFA